MRAYGEALALIATLRPAVDAFFDKVMVLDPDEKIRGAHLGLIERCCAASPALRISARSSRGRNLDELAPAECA